TRSKRDWSSDVCSSDLRTQETTQLQIGDWVEDSLVLFDLGYLDYARLARIDRNGSWFVSRLNVDANPKIPDELRTWCGDTIDLRSEERRVGEEARSGGG